MSAIGKIEGSQWVRYSGSPNGKSDFPYLHECTAAAT